MAELNARALLGLPLSVAYGCVTHLRNICFNQQYFVSKRLPVPVVSVGNITAGGTGKTPVVMELRKHFQKKNLSVGILSRGYGRSGNGIEEVTLDSERYFGDEPTLYKWLAPSEPIFVGASRFEAGQELLKKYAPSVLIADDGFQHRSLYRDLDLVLIDATQPFADYQLLPAGLGRESLKGLLRADFLILTKTGSPSAHSKHEVQLFLQRHGVVISNEKWIEAQFLLGTPIQLSSGSEKLPSGVTEVNLVSAIGRPQAFEKMCESQLGVRVKRHFAFRDHHAYRETDLRQALLEEKILLTTEKDAVKLKRLKIPLDQIYAVPLKVEFGNNKEKLYESLDRLSTSRS